ncbi:hypothetical protein BJX76DRAFT_339490 [Aspergillus varians]
MWMSEVKEGSRNVRWMLCRESAVMSGAVKVRISRGWLVMLRDRAGGDRARPRARGRRGRILVAWSLSMDVCLYVGPEEM